MYRYLACLLCLLPTLTHAQTLSKYEYWFDDNFSGRHSVSLSGTDVVVNKSLSTEGLDCGAHKFSFRVRQSDGKYSAITSSMFLKRPAAKSSVMEYWFDDNFDQRDVISISSTEDEQAFELDLRDNSKYPWGFHKLNMRVTLEGGGESAVYSSGVLKLSAGTASTLEYWLDDDRENIHTIGGSLASDGQDYLFVSDLDLGAVTPGHHRLYCRAVSNSGKTASAVTMTPIIVKSRYNISSADAKVTQYSLSIDDETPVVAKLGNPDNDIVFEQDFDVHDLTPGTHTLKAKFYNSVGAGVGDQAQFTMTVPEIPNVTLTATEKDGIVLLRFNLPSNHRKYRLVRRDANGTKATIYHYEDKWGGEDNEWFTDLPPAGNYTYYVQITYVDENENTQITTSNEVPVNVAQAQDELNNYGYVTGYISPDFGSCPRLRVLYSDGVETVTDNKSFCRYYIPSGTTLSITASGYSYEQFETKSFTVKPGENFVHIKALPSGDNAKPNNYNHDLQFSSDLEWVGNSYQFMVKNVTRKSWSGQVRLRIISKDKAQKEKLKEEEEGGDVVIPAPTTQVGTGSVAPLNLKAEDNYVYVYSDKISLSKDQSTVVTLSLDNVFSPDKKDWYYIYVESVGKWVDDSKDMVKVKPVGIDQDFNVTENPILRQVDKSLLAKAQEKVLMQDAEYAANVILLICSKLNKFNGIIGDVEQFGKDLAEKGKKMKDLDMAKLNRYVENAIVTETAEELVNDEMLQSFVSGVLGNATLILVEDFRDKVANEIFKGSKVVSQYLGDAIKVLKYVRDFRDWEKMNDYEKFFYCADAILEAADKYPGNPLCSILKTYSKVAKSFIQKALEYGETYYKMQEVDLLFENIPSEKDRPRYDYNRHVDFKIKVRTNRWVFFNFDRYGTYPIREVVVKVHNRPSDPDAVATIHFDLVPVWDGVMLRQTSMDSGGDLGVGYLDEGYPVDRMWMEIKWKNGRITKVPLRNDIDGVDFDGVSLTQNTKQYTVYLQSGTTKFANMADIIEVKE